MHQEHQGLHKRAAGGVDVRQRICIETSEHSGHHHAQCVHGSAVQRLEGVVQMEEGV